jgi:hypothetical protein
MAPLRRGKDPSSFHLEVLHQAGVSRIVRWPPNLNRIDCRALRLATNRSTIPASRGCLSLLVRVKASSSGLASRRILKATNNSTRSHLAKRQGRDSGSTVDRSNRMVSLATLTVTALGVARRQSSGAR